MNMIEKAARALCLNMTLSEDGWHRFTGPARAVLMAIREPSEEMCQAARDAKYLFAIETQASDAIGWTFEAMIDAELGEG